jgi:hypothetical protein
MDWEKNMSYQRTKTRNALFVTPGSIELYRKGLDLRPGYEDCQADRTTRCTHPECAEYAEARTALNMAFNVLPHQPPPLDSYAEIRSLSHVYPPGKAGRDNARTLLIKEALDAALPAEITQEPKP